MSPPPGGPGIEVTWGCRCPVLGQSVVFLFAVFLLPTASGLLCLQCMSLDQPSCVEGRLSAHPCQGQDEGSTYCLKSIGTEVSGHGEFVFRSCSKTKETNCTLENVHGSQYTVCHASCSEDGCNGGPSTSRSANDVMLTLTPLFTTAFLALRRLRELIDPSVPGTDNDNV